MSKKSFALPAIGAVALILAACSSGSGGSTAASSAAAAAPSAAASAPASAAAYPALTGDLTFVAWGGDGQQKQKEAWLDPFSELTGVNFKMDEPIDQSKVKAMVDAGNVTWDLVDNDAASAQDSCGVLYDKRPADFDLSQIDPKYVTDDCIVPVMGQSVALVYNKKLFGDNPPTSITDFMDTKKFPGQRIALNYWVGAAEILEMAAGTAPDKVYPYNWDTLQGAVNKLGSDLTFQNSLDLASQAMESGDFAMCACFLGRAGLAAQNGADIGVVWDKIYTAWDGIYAVKGSKNPTGQWEFLKYLATPEGQNAYYQLMPYSTTTTTPVENIPEAFVPFIPENNADQIGTNLGWDVPYLAKNVGEIADKWSKLTAG